MAVAVVATVEATRLRAGMGHLALYKAMGRVVAIAVVAGFPSDFV